MYYAPARAWANTPKCNRVTEWSRQPPGGGATRESLAQPRVAVVNIVPFVLNVRNVLYLYPPRLF